LRKLKVWLTAAQCIDWAIPCPSIFDRKKPLAETTQRRIAKGIMRYVLNAAEPFIVTMAHGEGEGKTKRWGAGVRDIHQPMPTLTGTTDYGLAAPFITEHANSSNQRVIALDEPLRTQCAQVKGGHFSLVAPFLGVHYGANTPGGERVADIDEPLRTQSTENRFALVTAFLAQFNTTGNGKPNVGHPATEPVSTITASGTQQGIVASTIVKMRGDNVGQDADEPLHTISAGGTHHADVRAFLIKYYGTDQDPELREPLHTITTKDRFGMVTVKGELYRIADIGLRMLWPRELFRAQGFPDSYIIGDKPEQGLTLTKAEQVRMVGNSVCPPLAKALVQANLVDLKVSVAA
jgi:DNA (cytosine-5)-methyltransferase 1